MIRGGGGGRRRDDTTTLETTRKTITTTTRRTNNNNNAAENDDDDDDDGGVINVHQNLNNNNGNNDEYSYNNNGYHHHQHDNNNNTTRYHNNSIRSSSSLYDWMSKLFYNVLYSLGLKGKEGTILFLGLDNAGKTTLLHRLKSGGGGGTGHGNNKNDHNNNHNSSSSSHMRSYPPTDRPNHDTFTISKIQFSAWDLGGHEVVRYMWEDFCISTNINAILFLIDAADSERLEEAGYELDALICSHNTSNSHDDDDDYILKNIPIAILFNKCDLSNAQSSSTICDKIDYERLVNIHSAQYLQLFRISVLQNEGYIDAFQWISTFL